MVGRRHAAEAAAFRRRQLITAFTRGSEPDPDVARRRPNRAFFAGVGLAIVAVLAVAAHGYLAGGPPSDWLDNGKVVVDAQEGGRYLSVHGVLHPVPNETSLRLLLHGSVPTPVTVRHSDLSNAHIGPTLGFATAPDRPPRLTAPGGGLSACTDAAGIATVVIGKLSPAHPIAGGALVHLPDQPTNTWVAGGRAHMLASLEVLQALGYTTDQVSVAPAPWLALVPVGSTLKVLSLPAPPPAKRGTPRSPVGSVIRDAATGTAYVVDSSGLRRVPNRTSLLLLGSGAGIRRVPHSELVAQPQGPVFGYEDVPGQPKNVPPASANASSCLTLGAGGPQVFASPPAPAADLAIQFGAAPSPSPSLGASPSSAPLRPGVRVVRQPNGTGLLLRPLGAPEEISAAAPAYLVAEGRAFPVTSTEALSDLGYQDSDISVVPPAWIRLLPAGPALSASSPTP